MAILVLAGRFGGALRENLYGTTATYGLGPNLREELYPLHDCMGVILTFLKNKVFCTRASVIQSYSYAGI